MHENRRASRSRLPYVLLLLVGAVIAQGGEALASDSPAQQEPRLQEGGATSAEPADSQDPFEKGSAGIELGMGLLGETWNLNNRREWLADGMLSMWWSFVNHATLVIEFHATRVFQEPSRDAFVTGILPVLRVRVAESTVGNVFAELGVGASWSDTAVPERGTRFNYLATAGLGVSRAIGRQTSLTTGFRWFHLSNNGREGRDRNPDIQALGGYAALTLTF